jgi:hypothetical protein
MRSVLANCPVDGEVSDLRGLPLTTEMSALIRGVHDLTFKTPGGFQQPGWLKLLQVLDQGLDAGFIVRHRQDLCGGADSDIELGFAHIDTDEDKGNFQATILLDYFYLLQRGSALLNMRAWITQATVRAFGEQGRDDPCYITVSNDRGADGLSRPFRINIFHRATLN